MFSLKNQTIKSSTENMFSLFAKTDQTEKLVYTFLESVSVLLLPTLQ